IEFRNVPPELYTVHGISWISSKIGKPLTKFVRDGANIRVCVSRDRAIPCPSKVKVDFSDSEKFGIEVMQHKPREYKKGVGRAIDVQASKSIWLPKEIQGKGYKVNGIEGNGSEPSNKGQDPPAILFTRLLKLKMKVTLRTKEVPLLSRVRIYLEYF
ncbi:hypothetical protein LINPERPRIM_LOCUS21690, partial [Linum perenne]